MRKEHIKPFLRAAETVSKSFYGLDIAKSELSLEKKLYMEKDIIVALGIKGEISGIVLLGFSTKEALMLSSHVLAKEGLSGHDKWDELSQSVLLEFGNRILGYATELYGENGIITDITTPSFINKNKLKNYNKENVSLVVTNELGSIEVKFHIKGK
jgi:chemotaxis protein CheX